MRPSQSLTVGLWSSGLAIVALCLTQPAVATTVTARLTADNLYSYYISTDDAQAGPFIAESPFGWWNVATFTNSLIPGVPQFLHIMARDEGPPAMFIGDFTLSDSNFEFANGTQSLITNGGDWGVKLSGFGGSYSTPEDLGPNGTAPWGVLNVSLAARYIWGPAPNFWDERYFSAAILPVSLEGDFNKDGNVDAADYVTWSKGLGTTYTQSDFDVWRAHFGQTAVSGSGASMSVAIPEPVTQVLLMIAAAGWCLRRGRAA